MQFISTYQIVRIGFKLCKYIKKIIFEMSKTKQITIKNTKNIYYKYKNRKKKYKHNNLNIIGVQIYML